MRLEIAVLAFLLVPTAALGAEPRPTSAPHINISDLTPKFDQFWRSHRQGDSSTIGEEFRAVFDPLLPGFYDPQRLKRSPEKQDQIIVEQLGSYPTIRTRVLSVSQEFSKRLPAALQRFTRTFPRTAWPEPVVLLHSLGEMDGRYLTLGDKPYLIFGADMIAKYHGAGNNIPFFQHELFHVYHRDYFKGCAKLYCGLWSEGLATYVAKALNPEATNHELLLDIPRPIPLAVDANRQQAVCLTLQKLDSAAREDRQAFFSAGQDGPDGLPPRFGYYVGYLAAKEATKTYPITQLAKMDTAQVRLVVERSLRRLATCP